MSIRQKLAIIFTLLGSLVMLGAFVFVYTFTRQFAQQEFADRLLDRAFVIGQLHFAVAKLGVEEQQKLESRYHQTLANESVLIFDAATGRLVSGTDSLDGKVNFRYIFDTVRKKKKNASKDFGLYQAVGTLQHGHVIVVAAVDMFGDSKLDFLRYALGISFVFVVIMLYVAGQFFSRLALKPIDSIVNRVQEITAANLSLRVPTSNNRDEIARLAQTFNQTLDRLQSAFVLQKQFVQNASHELRTPVTAIIGQLEVALARQRTPEGYRETMEIVLSEAEHMKVLINDLLELATLENRFDAHKEEKLRIDDVIFEAYSQLKHQYAQAQLLFSIDDNLQQEPAHLEITGQHQWLSILFKNLMDNALKYSNQQPVKVQISLRGHELQVSIADRGIGIPPTELDKINLPFYRASNVHGKQGHGLGLALCFRIAQMHSGRIWLSSQLGQGTTVTVALPTEKLAEE